MIRVLLTYALLVLRVLPALLRSQSEQVIVELMLRQQLATYAANRSRSRLTPVDRAFWVALSRIWPRWKASLVIVQPETVVRGTGAVSGSIGDPSQSGVQVALRSRQSCRC